MSFDGRSSWMPWKPRSRRSSARCHRGRMSYVPKQRLQIQWHAEYQSPSAPWGLEEGVTVVHVTGHFFLETSSPSPSNGPTVPWLSDGAIFNLRLQTHWSVHHDFKIYRVYVETIPWVVRAVSDLFFFPGICIYFEGGEVCDFIALKKTLKLCNRVSNFLL